MMEDKHALKPMLLLTLFKLEKITQEFFVSELEMLSIRDLILIRGRVERERDAVDDLLREQGISVEGNGEYDLEGKEEEFQEGNVVAIVERVILEKLKAFSSEKIAEIIYDEFSEARDVLLDAFFFSIEDGDLKKVVGLIHKFYDTDLHDAIADAMEDILETRSRTEVVFGIIKDMPEAIEDQFFNRLKNELDDCTEPEMIHIVENTTYDLVEAAFSVVLSKIHAWSTDGLVVFLNNAGKAEKEQGAVGLLREEIYTRIKNEDIEVLMGRMKNIEDVDVITYIILGELYNRKDELIKLLETLS